MLLFHDLLCQQQVSLWSMEDAYTPSLYDSSNKSYSSTLSDYDSYCNITLWNKFDLFYIFDYTGVNSQYNSSDGSLTSDIQSVSYVTRWIIICTGFPLTILAIYAFYSMVCEFCNLQYHNLFTVCVRLSVKGHDWSCGRKQV